METPDVFSLWHLSSPRLNRDVPPDRLNISWAMDRGRRRHHTHALGSVLHLITDLFYTGRLLIRFNYINLYSKCFGFCFTFSISLCFLLTRHYSAATNRRETSRTPQTRIRDLISAFWSAAFFSSLCSPCDFSSTSAGPRRD